MLSPKTLPHIVMIAVISAILLLLVNTQENFVSFAFISLSLSYALIAVLSNSKTIQKLIKLPEQKSEASIVIRFFMSFRITIVPILIAASLLGFLWYGLGGDSNKWISPLLASLFIVWSIAQAASFRTGMVEWLANGLGDAKLHTYQEKISTASQIIVVQSFAFAVIWIGQMVSDSQSLTFKEALFGGIAFLLISVGIQLFILWLTKDEREASGVERGMAAFSFKWMIIAQIFITWHAFSIYRRTLMDPSDVSTIIEEGFLMSMTVIFAVWSLTTYTVRDGKRLISENASLPLGIAFGYAYAGSVSMLTGTFDSLKEVLIFGHVLTIGAMILLMRPTLRASRISQDIVNLANLVEVKEPEIEQETEVSEDEKDEDNPEENADENWQQDEEVDWDDKSGIEEDTNWQKGEDVEVVD